MDTGKHSSQAALYILNVQDSRGEGRGQAARQKCPMAGSALSLERARFGAPCASSGMRERPCARLCAGVERLPRTGREREAAARGWLQPCAAQRPGKLSREA